MPGDFSRNKGQGQFENGFNSRNKNMPGFNAGGFGGMGNSSRAGIARLFSNNNLSDLILKTGEPVMTIGGFSGSDKIITVDQFKQLVTSGAIRYAIISGEAGKGGFMGGNSNSDSTNWIEENGKVVLSSEWQDSTTLNNQRLGGYGGRNSVQLYDLK